MGRTIDNCTLEISTNGSIYVHHPDGWTALRIGRLKDLPHKAPDTSAEMIDILLNIGGQNPYPMSYREREHIAAISGALYTNKLYNKFYESFVGHATPGQLCIEMASALTKAEQIGGAEYVKMDWIAFVDVYVKQAISMTLVKKELPSQEDLQALIRELNQ